MRTFILLALKTRTSKNFSLEKLKDAGRIDLVCRTISNALWIAGDIRRDTIVHVVMMGQPNPPRIVSFNGATLKNMEPDERTIAKAIRQALKKGEQLALKETKNVSPGISVSKKALETIVKEKTKTDSVYYLHKRGKDIREEKFKKNITFILGDNFGLPPATEKLFKRLRIKKIRLGPKMLFASHCSILAHNELDRQRL